MAHCLQVKKIWIGDFIWILWAYYFDPGISDVAEAYAAAINGATADSHENFQQSSIQDKVNAFSELLRTDRTTAVSKIQDGLQYLSYVVISTSMPAAWSLDFYSFFFPTSSNFSLVMFVNR